MSAQHTEQPSSQTTLPLRTLGDIRAALRAGHGFPGDREDFELDLARALEASTEADLKAVSAVIVDYRGRIRLCGEPGFDLAVLEGEEMCMRIKREAAES